jgi:ABC-type glycerol-3-phosphate transport system substrate-binding protein
MISTVLAITMLVTILAGCKSSSINEDEQNHLPENTFSENTEKTVLTLATFNLDSMIQNRVTYFNSTNGNYYIEVIDYSQFTGETVIDVSEYGSNFDYYAGLIALNTEIITGKIPDIIDLSMLPYYQYASRGLLEDIYPYIESDSLLSRNDLVKCAFRAAEIDGKLYQLFPTFSISTIAGNPTVLGSSTGWNLRDLKAVLDSHPNADLPIGVGYTATKTVFLRHIISHSIDDFIDWNNSTVNFASNNFIEALEFVADVFPAEPIMGDDTNAPSTLIASGRQIMEVMNIHNLRDYRYYKAMFGGDIVFKGFPGSSGVHNAVTGITGLGITTTAKDKEGAWLFLRTLLDEEYQLSFYTGFPTNSNALETYIENWKEDSKNPEIINDPVTGEVLFELQPITQDDIDIFLALIDSMSVTTGSTILDNRFWNIIFESAEDYFKGQRTSHEVAEIVQNRTSRYVSEHS